MNQALAFIKPHVISSHAARDIIRSVFEQNGITVLFRKRLKGSEIAAQGLIDRHYAANARAGICRDPATLPVSHAAQQAFKDSFGAEWSQVVAGGSVVSGLVMQERLAISGEKLNEWWNSHKFKKLAGGLYVAYFDDQGVYVINGFYPSMREIFTAAEAEIELLVLEFDEAKLPWQSFRDDIIGSTNPAQAAANSIRGRLFRLQGELGISITYRENAIHASASAFEGLIEKLLWLPEWPLAEEPLWQELLPYNLSSDKLFAWQMENRLVTIVNRTASLLDMLENRGTAETATIMRQLLDDKVLS